MQMMQTVIADFAGPLQFQIDVTFCIEFFRS